MKRAAKSASESDEQVVRNVLATDGKTLLRSHDRSKGLEPLQLVSVWASEYGLTLTQVATDETSNEAAAVAEFIEKHLENDFESVPVRRRVTEETAHAPQETRRDIQFSASTDSHSGGRWSNLRTIGVVIRKTLRGGEESTQLRDDISSLRLGVQRFAQAFRSQRSIENTCHWSLDVTYREDTNRVRQRTFAQTWLGYGVSHWT